MQYQYVSRTDTHKGYVFFDFDDFLFYTNKDFVRFLHESFGFDITCKDLALTQDFHKLLLEHGLELPHEDFWNLVQKDYLLNIQYHENALPVDGVLDFVPKIAEKFLMVIVTNRQAEGRSVVEYLLNKHLPQCFHSIHFVHSNSQVVLKKSEFINQFQSELPKIGFFDDHIKEVETVGEHVPSFLFNPFGYHDYPVKKTVKSWEEVYEKILELSS